jgi:hypothetical protein
MSGRRSLSLVRSSLGRLVSRQQRGASIAGVQVGARHFCTYGWRWSSSEDTPRVVRFRVLVVIPNLIRLTCCFVVLTIFYHSGRA